MNKIFSEIVFVSEAIQRDVTNTVYIYIYTRVLLQIERPLFRSQLVSLGFFIDVKSFRSHYGPEIDSTSNRNEYQEHFLGVKAADA